MINPYFFQEKYIVEVAGCHSGKHPVVAASFDLQKPASDQLFLSANFKIYFTVDPNMITDFSARLPSEEIKVTLWATV